MMSIWVCGRSNSCGNDGAVLKVVETVHEPDGRIGTFCIYEARDGESIREHARRVGMPGDEFYKVATTVVVRSDPAEDQAAA